MKKDKKIIIKVRAIILHEGKLLERSNEFQVLVARGVCASRSKTQLATGQVS